MRAAFIDKTHLLIAGCIGLFGLATQASASPITYAWASGEATVSAINGNNGNNFLAAGAFLPLTAPSQVTFDSAALTVPGFEFTDQGTTSLALQGALTGDTLLITNLTAVPDAVTYTSSAVGSNPYNISLGELDVTGSFEVVNSKSVVVAGPKNFNQVDPNLTGQVTVSGGDMTSLTLSGVTFAAISIAGTPVTIKGDVEFSGTAPVPVPAAIWLLGSGLIGLSGSAFARRRRTVQPKEC
jgi:hypothetical protein